MYVAYGHWATTPATAEDVSSPYAVWVKDSLEVAFDQVRRYSGQAGQRQKRLYDQRAVHRLFAIGNWVMRYYPAGKKCKLDSIWTGPYLIVTTLGWTVDIQRHPDEPVIFIHCQDVKKIPPSGGAPAVPMLGASTVAHTSRDSPSVTALPPDEGGGACGCKFRAGWMVRVAVECQTSDRMAAYVHDVTVNGRGIDLYTLYRIEWTFMY